MNKPNCCDKCSIPETLTWCKNPSCECHIQKVDVGEPEKKDVWEREFFERFGANKIWVNPSKDNVETILDIWSFIKTHFIPRAEVVEKIDKLEPKLWDAKGKEFVPKSDLLDLLTQ